jgi:hypothetical protein
MALPDKALRTLIRRVISGPLVFTEKKTTSVNLQDSDSDGEPTGASGQGGSTKSLKEVIERVKAVPKVLEGLYLANVGVSIPEVFWSAESGERAKNSWGDLIAISRGES